MNTEYLKKHVHFEWTLYLHLYMYLYVYLYVYLYLCKCPLVNANMLSTVEAARMRQLCWRSSSICICICMCVAAPKLRSQLLNSRSPYTKKKWKTYSESCLRQKAAQFNFVSLKRFWKNSVRKVEVEHTLQKKKKKHWNWTKNLLTLKMRVVGHTITINFVRHCMNKDYNSYIQILYYILLKKQLQMLY